MSENKKPKSIKEAVKGKKYTVAVGKFGNYKKGDVILCHPSTGEALKSHKIVE